MKTWKPKWTQASDTTPDEVASISEPLPDQSKPPTTPSRSRHQTYMPPPVAISGNDMDIFKDAPARQDEGETWIADVTPEPPLASHLHLSPVKPKPEPASPPSRERWGVYGNVRDMAKRKMFFSEPVVLEEGRKNRKDRSSQTRVGDRERREHEDRKDRFTQTRGGDRERREHEDREYRSAEVKVRDRDQGGREDRSTRMRVWDRERREDEDSSIRMKIGDRERREDEDRYTRMKVGDREGREHEDRKEKQ
ncbi:hypothetical protein MPER_04020, partial [Moniliophthora perniciosa FA553]